MKLSALGTALLLSLVAGCGGSPPPADEPAKPAPKHAEDHGGKHHHDLAGGMKSFHDVLAPPYHMVAGPERIEKTCSAVAAMKDAGVKLAAEPKGDTEKWKAAAKALSDGVDALDKACQVKGRGEVEAKLETVHDAFHALMDLGKA